MKTSTEAAQVEAKDLHRNDKIRWAGFDRTVAGIELIKNGRVRVDYVSAWGHHNFMYFDAHELVDHIGYDWDDFDRQVLKLTR